MPQSSRFPEARSYQDANTTPLVVSTAFHLATKRMTVNIQEQRGWGAASAVVAEDSDEKVGLKIKIVTLIMLVIMSRNIKFLCSEF